MVTFTLRYQGRSTEVNALVSDAVKDEILLSWGVLKNLGVIDDTFPKPPDTIQNDEGTGIKGTSQRHMDQGTHNQIDQTIHIIAQPTGLIPDRGKKTPKDVIIGLTIGSLISSNREATSRSGCYRCQGCPTDPTDPTSHMF